MSKKKKENTVEDAAKLAAVQEEQRRKAIADFNVSNMGKYWIDPDKVPTDEDIENAKKEFEERTKALQEKKDYMVADKVNALRVAKFMKNFNDQSVWSKRMFVGLVNFSALMDDFINGFDENNPVDLVLEYPPIQYAFLVFENYGGNGIEDAKKMAEMWDEYLPIYEKLHEIVDQYNAEVKACEELRDRWGMFEQGYYVYILDPEENPTEQKEEPVESGEPTKE